MGVPKTREFDIAGARLAANVAGYALGLSEPEILAVGRGGAEVAFARQVAMYLCYVAFGLSLTRVAAAFGRDRSTVAHACRLMEDRRDEPQFELWIASLEAMLRAAPAPGLGRIVSERQR